MRFALAAFSVALCVAAPAHAQQAVPDPWEGFNRDLYAVHDAVDRAVLEPIARGYRTITPAPVRTGVRQFLRNLRSPAVFANDVLQGEPGRAGVAAARFGINTTFGVLGVFDPASSMGLEPHDEDFGQTLGAWGVSSGPYLFIPILGPTTVRDGAGRIVDMAFDPLRWAEFDDVETVRAARGAMTGISARENLLEPIDDIRANAVDPYAAIRTSYGLMRQSAIQNGQTDVQDLPDFDENFDMPDEPGAEDNSQQLPENPAPAPNPGLAQTAQAPTSFALYGGTQ